MGSQSCGSCQSIRQHWDELSFGTACTPVPAQALNPQCQHNPGARPFTAAVPEPPALSAGEPKGAEPEAAEELELGQGHELTSVQTGQSWAGLLDPLPAAETCAGFLPQRLFWDSGRSGSEELLATLRVTDMAFTPEGRGWVGFKSQWPGAEEPLTGSGALVPRWPWACSCHPHLQQVLGLELPMDPVCPQAGVPTTGLSPGTGNGPGETPGAALGSCPHHIWRPLTANLPCGSTLICRIHQAWWDNDANHPALPLWGQNRGGCAGGGDPHTVLLVHPHFTRCLLGAQSGLHSSCCNTEGLASQHHNGIHGSCKPLLREPKPAAGALRGTQPSWGRAKGRHLGLSRGTSAPFFSLTAGHGPTKHSGSGHLAPSGSSIISTKSSTVPHVIPRAGWQQQCCRLVTQLLGKVPGVPEGKGWRAEAMGHAAEGERC